MTFTIPPFVCGILATIIVEAVALIIAAAVKNKKQNKYTFKK